jgi:hypothetical protein
LGDASSVIITRLRLPITQLLIQRREVAVNGCHDVGDRGLATSCHP